MPLYGTYFNEMAAKFEKPTPLEYTRDVAYNEFVRLREWLNHWEQRRANG